MTTTSASVSPFMSPRRGPAFWVGWVLTVLPCLLLTFSGVMKLTSSPQVSEGFTHLGWPVTLARPLGILEIGSTLLFLFPPTCFTGAVLLTGYMGGAIATHVRIGEPFFGQAIFITLLWLALFLREPRLRPLLPWRARAS